MKGKKKIQQGREEPTIFLDQACGGVFVEAILIEHNGKKNADPTSRGAHR